MNSIVCLHARSGADTYALTGYWERLLESIQWTPIFNFCGRWTVDSRTATTFSVHFHNCFLFKIEIRTSRSLAVIHCLSTIDTCECTKNGKSSNLLWLRLRRYLRNSNINRHVSIWLFITRWWLTWVWNDLWRYLFCFSSTFLKNSGKTASLAMNYASNQGTNWVMRWIHCSNAWNYLQNLCS